MANRDPVIEAYKLDVDRTLIRENLKFTVTAFRNISIPAIRHRGRKILLWVAPAGNNSNWTATEARCQVRTQHHRIAAHD